MSTSAHDSSVEPPELSGKNAYVILGVSESCSYNEIKDKFRKLAKETHPDRCSKSRHNSDRFIQILAAYQVVFSFN
jgi:molecular chaperone DnaJ